MIVQTRSGKRGTVIDISPLSTPPDQRRVYVRLWLTLPGSGPARGVQRPPARVVVAYHPADVIEVRQLPTDR